MKRLSEGLRDLFSRSDAGLSLRLTALWRQWPEVAGEPFCDLARPLGRRRNVLLLGVEDPVVMQEAAFLAPEILERVNRRLGQIVFDKVQFDLLGDKVPLDEVRAGFPDYFPVRYEAPGKLGGLLGKLDRDSPVGRCYEKYVRFFRRSGGS